MPAAGRLGGEGPEGVYLLGGARTPFAEWEGGKNGRGEAGGALAGLSALELGAVAARGALERAPLPAALVDQIILGNALQTSADALYGARHVGLRAGVPMDRPALTVNRLCGSGIEAVVQAAHAILRGEARWVLAGGMESCSQAPFVLRGARRGLRLGHRRLEDSFLAALHDSWAGCNMATSAEILATDRELSRERQDEWALRSCERAARAERRGLLAEEIVPVERADGVVVDRDDHRVENCTLEGLRALRPAFSPEGCVTAGNASGVVDGACALVVAGGRTLPPDARPLARLLSHAVVGVEPSRMGLGPVPAVQLALREAGLALDQIDRLEINEAFAAQILPVIDDLHLDEARLNVHGGAIAHGHPLGATGARLLLSLALELRREGLRYGLAAACIGGGQGIALILESAGG